MKYPSRLARCAVLALGPTLALSCSDTDTAPSDLSPNVCTEPRPALEGSVPDGCDLAVSPSDNDLGGLQAALFAAGPGNTICLAEGTYELSVELTLQTEGVTLRGAGLEETILEFKDQDLGANGLSISADEVTIEDLSVKNTKGDGIRATGVSNIAFRNVGVIWDADASEENGAYGLYPVGCSGVLVEGCVVKGARDAGIYVGQSTDIVVRDNVAYGNVAGIEIENSTDAEVYGNHAYENTAGILVFSLPGLPVPDGRRTKVHNNLVENNNLDNFASGGIVSIAPKGLGVMILASDENEVTNNEIRGNQSAGVVIVSFNNIIFGANNDPDFDIYPQNNHVHDNVFDNNGYDPAGLTSQIISAEQNTDYLEDGCLDPDLDTTSQINCVDEVAVNYANGGLCDTGTKTLEEATCSYEELGGVTFSQDKPASEPLSSEIACSALSSFELFESPMSSLSPASRGFEYEVISPLWSDNAVKRRHIFVPEGEVASIRSDGGIDFPVGTIISKTFLFPADMSRPDEDQRLVETRLLIRGASGWTAENYLWNDEQTDAVRAAGGARTTVSYRDIDGEDVSEDYVVPAVGHCASCHDNGDRMELLGLRAEQLSFDSGQGDQLERLRAAGLAEGAYGGAVLVDPFGDASLEERARSYLHANCAHCHSMGGAAGSSGLMLGFEIEDETALGICKIPAAAGSGAGGLEFDIVPGNAEESILPFRMASTEPAIRMPELPNRLVHDEGVALVSAWIDAMSGGCE